MQFIIHIWLNNWIHNYEIYGRYMYVCKWWQSNATSTDSDQLPLENSNNTAPVDWLTSQPANQSVHTKQPSVIRWVSFAHRFCCYVHSRLVPNRLHSSDCQLGSIAMGTWSSTKVVARITPPFRMTSFKIMQIFIIGLEQCNYRVLLNVKCVDVVWGCWQQFPKENQRKRRFCSDNTANS